MNLTQFYCQDFIQTPIIFDNDDSSNIIDFSCDLLFQYISSLKDIDKDIVSDIDIQSIIDKTANLCIDVKEIFQSVYKGHYNNAITVFNSTMLKYKEVINNFNIGIIFNQPLYRIRLSSGAPLSRGDIFHIPLNKRHIVKNQRFSLPGIPCLYLSGSIYTCWEEMERPAFHEFSVSSFSIKPDSSIPKLLDISGTPSVLKYWYGLNELTPDNIDVIQKYLELWPLIALCSFKSKYSRKDSSFHHEYIFPQLLMQWIATEKNFDGVIYASTASKHIEQNTRYFSCNVAMPVKTDLLRGFCPFLSKMLDYSDPINMQMLDATHTGRALNPPMVHQNIEITSGVFDQYELTSFGLAELKIQRIIEQQKSRLPRSQS